MFIGHATALIQSLDSSRRQYQEKVSVASLKELRAAGVESDSGPDLGLVPSINTQFHEEGGKDGVRGVTSHRRLT